MMGIANAPKIGIKIVSCCTIKEFSSTYISISFSDTLLARWRF